MSVESRIPSIHLILCCSLLLLPSIFPRIRVFFKGVSSSHQVAKLWSFSCSIRPYSEYSGLISFRIDWFVLLAVQGTLKGLLQHYGSKASFLWCSAFLMVQLSHPHVTTGKTIALTRWTFSSCLQSFPVSSSFPVNQLFASCGQSIRVSASASVLPMNIQDWYPLGLTGLISLQSKGLSRVFPSTPVWKHYLEEKAAALNLLYGPALTSIHDYWKNHAV